MFMTNLNTPVEKLSYVGPKMLPRLRHLGIKTIRDLLRHFPARYEDFSKLISLAEVGEPKVVVSVRGVVRKIKTDRIWKRRLAITTAIIDDGTGKLRVVWFNQPYLQDSFPEGTELSLSGKTALDKRGLYLSSPVFEKIGRADEDLVHTSRIVPVYPETEGVSSKFLRFLIKPLLDKLGGIPDSLPAEIVKKYNFPAISKAIKNIHFPKKLDDAEAARKRFAFEELFLFQLRALLDRKNLEKMPAPKILFDKDAIAKFVRGLPFPLTNDQRLAAFEILKDLERGRPMNRLLNGDVGSGKTVVALIAMYQTVKAGYQAVIMAPTEILAKQHFGTITSILEKQKINNIKVGLLIGSEARQWPTDEITEADVSKKILRNKVAKGQIDILIGTHAVIQKDVAFNKLALVVIDEQHRFGVGQRMKLVKNQELAPHLLSMTATPIPRTLALTIYGDLDVSLLKQKPGNRPKIITKIIPARRSAEAYEFIENEIKKGRQVFVICPRIETPLETASAQGGLPLTGQVSQAKLMWAEVKAVTKEFEKLSKETFPHRRVAMLHGKIKPKEKEKIMNDFRAGEYDILVSTSVVEVGVDIPNATVMMIESAERFGLAQLHQFRGRVGRGEHQSYCFLFTSSGGEFGSRLKALEKTGDGFELAEMDLQIRGPGEFTGVKQSGIPDLVMASLGDIELIKKARSEAEQILNQSPTLANYPLLRERLEYIQKMVHFE
ncbi:MAG: ATP-dependent DNA helicase RecG [Parcubacteria group bacterium Licking1014_17]|nr:MAG: ATP-dependent DNA helicase RecG [Parcubacteria group bacterium Licking1014_17]